MTEYQEMAKRQRVWMLFILVFFIVLAVIMPQKDLFAGIILGVVISFYNLWLLQRKINAQGEAAASVGKRKGLGMISRFAAAALGALLALRMELSLVGYIIGLMTAYPVIVIDYLWFNRK
ncbi:MAG TPA: ATP synthase subunit I [Virgibacillus sp.]|nr:ATP synthase subunit I [Virgibacillus sp.]HLR66920.1 ATP synthase subunit I [Virgibacillus sp.]